MIQPSHPVSIGCKPELIAVVAATVVGGNVDVRLLTICLLINESWQMSVDYGDTHGIKEHEDYVPGLSGLEQLIKHFKGRMSVWTPIIFKQ